MDYSLVLLQDKYAENVQEKLLKMGATDVNYLEAIGVITCKFKTVPPDLTLILGVRSYELIEDMHTCQTV